MRSTLHLFSAADYAALRLALQPPMSVALRVLGARAEGLDPDAVVSATRELLAGNPLTFDAIRAGLQERFPDVNDRALGYAARTLVPLVMVPDGGGGARWGYPRVCRVRAGRGVPRRRAGAGGARGARRALPRRVRSRERRGRAGVVGRRRDEGRARRDARRGWRCSPTSAGRELFDLPDAPRPGADVEAPVRYLPEFDNLVLAYDDRTRVIADEHRPLVTTKNLRVRATFLVDGVVAGDLGARRQAARGDGGAGAVRRGWRSGR